MRILSSATLVLASQWIFWIWFGFDFIVFTSMKFFFERFGIISQRQKYSFITNVITFIERLRFLFQLRNPFTTVCGLQYQIFRYYTAAASVGMVLVSTYLQQEEGVVDDSTLRLCLYAVLVLASISASAAVSIHIDEKGVQLDGGQSQRLRALFKVHLGHGGIYTMGARS